jgi:two-component system sensor histidine kinase KdpD
MQQLSVHKSDAMAGGQSAGRDSGAEFGKKLQGCFRATANSRWGPYAAALFVFGATSVLNLWLHPWIGYQATALVYLLGVVLLARSVERGPLALGTVLSAAGWSFLFCPPRYSFHISAPYDRMMLVTYVVVAVMVGQLTARLRRLRDAELTARMLAESERLGRTLLNSVSHELRTPIAAIRSAASTIQTSGAVTPIQKQLLMEIDSATQRLNRVVQSLLSAARLRSGQLKPRLDWCDVSELVRVSLRNVGTLVADHPLEVDMPSGLPMFKADFALLEQAVSNLLVNAAVHTPPATPITVAAKTVANELWLEVADRGPGLTVQPIERVFDLFYRAEGARPGGTGVGLAIVKGFVEMQGGRVQAANQPGGGALFRICLPLTDAPQLRDEPSES